MKNKICMLMMLPIISMAGGTFIIGDRVWHDSNENWEQDNGEQGVEGVTVNLFKANGEKVSTTKTKADGKYNFKALPEGDYVVKVELPECMTTVTDTKLEVWLDKSRTDKDFGLLKKGDNPPPPNGEPITLEKLKEMIANGEDVTKVNTSQITDMSGLFYNNKTFNQSLNKWNVSEVRNMKWMFSEAKGFNQPLDNWNVSKVKNMGVMFSGTTLFNQSLNNWDISNVKYMNAMFYNATAFNQPIGNWDVSNVRNMAKMFKKAKAFNQPLNNWDVSNVRDMEFMFSEADAFNQSLDNWDVSKVGLMTNMFFYMDNFNQNISMWNVENVRKWVGFYAGTDIADEKIPEKFRK